MHNLKKFLESKAYQMRVSSLVMTTNAGSGHPTSALSAADIVAALFFYAMRFDPSNPNDPNNDRFILSKGHASPVLYAAWKELGILSEQDLMTYRQFGSVLEGHPTRRFSRTDAATGSLGMGLSNGAGMAISAKMDKRDFHTYVMLGDGECAEGSVWEALEISAYYKLDNLIAILDCNRLGQSDETMYGYHVQRYASKFESFGWKTLIIDGHDMQQIMGALDKAREHKDTPTMIIAKTIKGYGVSFAENKNGFHGKVFPKDELPGILKNMEEQFSEAAHFDAASYSWKPKFPEKPKDAITTTCDQITLKMPVYKFGEMIATRKAYGQAITAVGSVCKAAISLDGDVKNSTFAEIFDDKFPDRFIQCFIAEQNMVSMAVGLNLRGKIPFVSTFGAFFTRAHDQLRMAAIGNASLRLSGSHCGVSIGQDGPSQMALEDLPEMRDLPDSIVLYPCDAVSTYKLIEQMANYNKGISYIRTTRMDTPVIYDNAEEFPVGGCKIVHQSEKDKILVVGAGITLHEALKAFNQLEIEGISIAVIDLYSIKPMDQKTILAVAQSAGKKVITVEDHYIQGGIGEAVTYELRNTDILIECLAVTKLPRSGKPEELMAWEGIDAEAIINKVKEMI
jgi:transketolase